MGYRIRRHKTVKLFDTASIKRVEQTLAGPAIHTQSVKRCERTKVLTVLTTGFDPAAATGGSAAVEVLTPVGASAQTTFVGSEIAKNDHPELTAAKIIVSGGRALGSSEKFMDVMTPLAEKLGAALGSSRAAVDAGYAPNDWHVGQTGKIVAPPTAIDKRTISLALASTSNCASVCVASSGRVLPSWTQAAQNLLICLSMASSTAAISSLEEYFPNQV
ncbi:MAG: electron transfer flavoprotein subunit alpha/FixB family protein [Rhodoferax sp.]|nr:electron transfer flavoprotein subunit alpha/FixB family protein [Rhodoferax sp.]